MSTEYRVQVGQPPLTDANTLLLMDRILTSSRSEDVIIDNEGNVLVSGSTEPICP